GHGEERTGGPREARCPAATLSHPSRPAHARDERGRVPRGPAKVRPGRPHAGRDHLGLRASQGSAGRGVGLTQEAARSQHTPPDGRPARHPARARRTVTLAPRPTSLVTQLVPPCAATICWDTYRPSPSPP